MNKLLRNILHILIATIISTNAHAQSDAELTDWMTIVDDSFYNNPDTALYYAHKVLKHPDIKRDSVRLSTLYNRMGSSYWVRGDFVTSLEYFQKSIRIGELLEDTALMAKGYGNASVISIDLEDYEPALNSSLLALNMFTQLNDSSGIAVSTNNIGVIYEKLGKYDSALNYYNSAYTIWTQINDKYWRGLVQSNISMMYTKLNMPKKAMMHASMAIQLSEEEGITKNKGHAYLSMAKAFILKGDNDMGLFYAQKALTTAETQGIVEIMRDAHEQLYIANKNKKNYNDAITHLETFTKLSDSMVNSNKLKLINHLMTKVKFEQKNKEIAEREIELAISENARQRNLLLLILAGILLISIIIVAWQVAKKQNLKLQTKQQQLKMEQQKLELANLNFRNEQLVNMNLNKELDLKKQELLSYTISMTQKNQLLQDLNEKVDTISSSSDAKDIRSIKNTINAAMGSEENWEEFKTRFVQVHHSFFDHLKTAYPQLSPNDLRLCAFIKLNLSSKQIASLLNIAPSSVDISKYRLKKKFGLEKSDDLSTFIEKLHNS